MTDPQPHSWTGRERTGLFLILIVASAFRLVGLTTAPPPLNHDEASRGYDAWSILETGAGRHGERWPFFLKSYGPGDYTAALSTYLLIPFVALMGPTALAFRLPGAILSIITVLILFLWLRKHHNCCSAIIAATIMAVDPWHISITRTAYEFSIAPVFLATALWALDSSGLTVHERMVPPAKAARWAALAGVMLAFHAWVYPASRLFTPLFLIAFLCIYISHMIFVLRQQAWRRILLITVFSLFLASTPLWATAVAQPERLAARARAAVLDFHISQWPQTLPVFAKNYLRYFDPRMLWTQPDTITAMPIPSIGMHLWIAAPLILAGLIATCIRSRHNFFYRMIIAWLLLAPLPAAICIDIQPHVIRTISAMLLWPLLAGLGGDWLWQECRRLSLVTRQAIIAIAAIAFTSNTAYFGYQYFHEYPVSSRRGFQTDLIEAIRYASHQSDIDFILVTNRANQPYIYALLYGPIPPHVLANNPIVCGPGPANFDQVVRVEQYFFLPQDPVRFPEAGQRFAAEWSTLPKGAVGLVIERPEFFKDGSLIRQFGDEKDGFEVRRWIPTREETPANSSGSTR